MSGMILVGVDSSAASSRAATFAAERARAEQASVVVAHIVPWSPFDTGTTPEDNEQRHPRREAELAQGKRDIAGPAADALRAEGVAVDVVVRHGHPAQTLSDLAEEHGVTQLIVGRTGETGLRAVLFGSVPSSLVQISPVPVTVVP